jgi:hypothetical protein
MRILSFLYLRILITPFGIFKFFLGNDYRNITTYLFFGFKFQTLHLFTFLKKGW